MRDFGLNVFIHVEFFFWGSFCPGDYKPLFGWTNSFHFGDHYSSLNILVTVVSIWVNSFSHIYFSPLIIIILITFSNFFSTSVPNTTLMSRNLTINCLK